jgi:hypothetical protein
MSSSDGEQLHEDMLELDMSEYFLGGSGVTSEQLRALDPRALVELAIRHERVLKLAWIELARRGPEARDAAAERRLIELYREGWHRHWLTVSLLRYVGGSRSYELAWDILSKGAGSLSESYAGETMIAIDRERARRDLLEVICDEQRPVRLRRCAGDALKGIVNVDMLPAIVEAVRARRLGVARASAVLKPLDLPSAELVAWLEDDDDAVARMGFALGLPRDALEPSLAQAMRAALVAERVELAPSERARAEGLFSRSLGM